MWLDIAFIVVFTESLKRRKTKSLFMERVEENYTEHVTDKENVSEFLS